MKMARECTMCGMPTRGGEETCSGYCQRGLDRRRKVASYLHENDPRGRPGTLEGRDPLPFPDETMDEFDRRPSEEFHVSTGRSGRFYPETERSASIERESFLDAEDPGVMHVRRGAYGNDDHLPGFKRSHGPAPKKERKEGRRPSVKLTDVEMSNLKHTFIHYARKVKAGEGKDARRKANAALHAAAAKGEKFAVKIMAARAAKMKKRFAKSKRVAEKAAKRKPARKAGRGKK
jgi:hypothetical protein